MNERTLHLTWLTMMVGGFSLLTGRTAGANGRFPAADQLVINPSDPTHIVARTTYGFVETRNSGKTWLWTCEEIIGRISNFDPPLGVMGDGTIVVAVPFAGVSVSHDHGCTWSVAPAPLMGQLAMDVTIDPSDPASLVVLTSTNDTPDGGTTSEFLNLVVETKDNAATWKALGTPLPRDFIASTIEIARSDPNRIYTSGVFGEPLAGAIERSEDGGKTWSRAIVPTPTTFGSVYISAIDARNADRLFVRITGQQDPATTLTPTTLLVTNDKGANWTELVHTDDSMLGFALSPDGAMLAYGTQRTGIFIGPADGSGPFENVNKVQNRCLTWSDAGLYACAMTPPDPFAIALSGDRGKTFQPLYQLADTCPTVCPDDGRFNQICRRSWNETPGIALTTGATGENCSVPWAKTDGGAGRSDASSSADGGPIPEGGTSDGGVVVMPAPSNACACRLGANRRAPNGQAALGLAFVALIGGAWAKRRTARRSPPAVMLPRRRRSPRAT